MKLGLALPHYDTSLAGRPVSWESVKHCAMLAERSGFHSIWVSDHLFLDWSKYGGSEQRQGALECWTTMSGLAACTERVRIGSLTLCNDLRNPGLVAKMAATLDLLSGGRVEVGMGAGWYEPEYRAAGIELSSPGKRIARLAEAAEVVRRLLDGEELFFKGDHYVLDGALCRPLPAGPRPRLWLGGKGNKLLDAAARVADGWNLSWIGSFDAYRERARAADEACARHGREPDDLARSVGVYVVAGADANDARRRFERLVAVTPPGVLTSAYGGPAVSWEEFRRDHVCGGAQEVTDRLGQLAELGVEEVVVGLGGLPFQVADEDDIELVGTEIAPALE